MSSDASSSLGTGSFSQGGTTGGPAFCMSNASWLSLQTFLNDAAALPATTTALSTLMGYGAPTDMSDFDKLVNLYASMQSDTSVFKTHTYPMIVSLASDIYDYNSSITVYYQGLKTLVDAINNAGSPTSTQKTELSQIFSQLAATVTPFITKATLVKNDLAQFVSNMQNHASTLSQYQTYYHDEYGTQSTAVQTIQTQLSTNIASLGNYQDEYNQDVTVAATSPTYAWIVPMGTLAATIVSGVFGAKATYALEEMHATQSTINTLNDQETADNSLMTGLNTVTSGINKLQTHLTNATSILEGIEGNWTAIGADLNNIENGLSTGSDTLAFLLEINYNELISEWGTLAGLCDSFRQNAFITVSH